MTALLNDLRYTLRQLRKSLGFTLVAMLTLALGIGANTAVFTMVYRVLLAPLRFSQPDRIVQINTQWTNTRRAIPRVTDGDVPDLRDQSGIFQYFSTMEGDDVGVQLPGRAVFTRGYAVNPQFFSVLGIAPKLGRFFLPQDAGKSAVVSESFALRNFGSAANALGKVLRFDKQAFQIVGVAPEGLEFPRGTGFWAAYSTTPDSLDRTSFNYHAIARLRPGVTLTQAQAQIDALGNRLAAQHPVSNQSRTFLLRPLQQQLVASVRQTLWFLMSSVACVLLIACVNVANLFLARTTEKSREIAARIALGATRWRIVRQLLTESMWIAVSGGAVGMVLGQGLLRLLIWRMPADFPRLDEVSLDGHVLAFTLGISVAAALLFGMVPAWQASQNNPEAVLRQNSLRSHGTPASRRLRETLIVVEVALSLLLVFAAGLLLHSLLLLNKVDPGFRTKNILVMDAGTPAQTPADALHAAQQIESIREQLQAMPGIRSAAAVYGLPMGDAGSNGSYVVEGHGTWDQPQGLPHADFAATSPDYFSTMRIPLVRGRDFRPDDVYGSTPVAIVSESLARQSFPNQNPLGRRIQCGDDPESMQWMTIVGVVKDVRQDSLASQPAATLYMPLAQHPIRARQVQFALDTAGNPWNLQGPVQRKVHSLDPAIAMRFHTMRVLVDETSSASRFRTALLGSFGLLALLLAILGVYGVMAYSTAQRAAEIGIRIAFGASRGKILFMFLRRALQLAAIGIALGVLAAMAVGHSIASMLYGVQPLDPLTYALGILTTLAAVLLAAYVPARRAADIDPMQALRSE